MKKLILIVACVVAVLSAAMLRVSPAGAVAGPAIAVCATGSEETSAQSLLQGTGLFSSVDALGCDSSTPSLATLQNYSAVYAFPDSPYADFPTLAQNLRDYVNGGGHLVLGMYGWASCCGTWWNTALDTGGYLPFTNLGDPQDPDPTQSGGGWISVSSMQLNDPSSQLLSGVSSVTDSFGGQVGLASGATLVASWDDGASSPAVAYKGNIVALNIFIYGVSDGSGGDALTLLTNALLFNNSPGKTPIDEHVGFCTVAGNYNPATGVAYAPGTFLVLDEGWDSTVTAYKGAAAANYVEGVGITCDPPPSGYTLQGYAPESDQVPGNTYPYYAKPAS